MGGWGGVGRTGTSVSESAADRRWMPACESERQHVVILVRNKGRPQLDTHNMWLSRYGIRAGLDSISITCSYPGTK